MRSCTRLANGLLVETDAPRFARARKTVYHYFRLWKLDGTWEKAMSSLRREVRTQMGRDPEPSAALIESQSIKTSPVRGSQRGFDGGKKNLGPQKGSSGGYPRISARSHRAG